MLGRRLGVAVGVAVVVLGGVGGYVAAGVGTTEAVSCTSDGVTLSCPLPPPVTVTETTTDTATETQTVAEPTVTVPGPTSTVTVLSTVTQSPAPSTSVAPTTTTAAPTTSTAPTTSSVATTTAAPTTTVAPASWPGTSNTGVPAGTTLTAYTGSCTITAANTVIDAKTVNCPNGFDVRAANLTVTRSKVVGSITIDTDINRTWSLTLTDSEVTGEQGDYPAITNGNVTILRANIHGGHNGLECQEHSAYCTMTDSWVHDQWQAPSGDTHLGGFLELGTVVPCTGPNGTCMQLVHNKITCDAPVNSSGGGCTGDINLITHFGPLSSALIQGNYLGANTGSAFCTYGGAGFEYPSSHIVYRDNVFARGTNRICAAYGPVTNFDKNAAGNVWTNNLYDDGTPVNPED